MKVFRIKVDGREYVAFGDTLSEALKDRGGITGIWKDFLKSGLVEEFSAEDWVHNKAIGVSEAAEKAAKEAADASKRTA